MATRVFIDGRITDEEHALVSVFDRGFLYGDSVYEVTRTFGGQPFALAEHLDRLERSARAIELEPPPVATIRQAVLDTIAAGGNPESYIRIVVTRGAGDIGLDPALADRPRLIVIVRQVYGPKPEMYADGVEVAVVSVTRNLRRAIDPAVKSGNYLNNVLAVAEAKKKGAYEAVMCDGQGRLAECASSNLFLVREGKIMTPALEVGLLDGITRKIVMQVAKAAGIPVEEAWLEPTDLRDAQEAFLTSSVRGVLPVVRVDGAPIGSGRPGETTRKIMALYAERTAVPSR